MIIKFRAWHKEEKRMVDSIQSIKTILCKELDGLNKDYILMQYTGLKDKDGREIYEGDIVRQRRFIRWDRQNGEKYKDIYGVVRFESGMFTCGIVDKTLIDWDKCEVIGNIWENHELLESEGEENVDR